MVKYHLISIKKSFSKIFITNFVCVLTNERYKTYQTGFSFCLVGHAPGVGLWGAGVAHEVKKINYGHVAYQINEDDKQTRMQVKFSSYGQTGDPGVRSNIIKFGLPCLFLIFLYQTLCAFLQIKDRKHIEQNLHSVAGGCPRGGTWEGWWVKNFSVRICDGTPSTAHFSLVLRLSGMIFPQKNKRSPLYAIFYVQIRICLFVL